MSKIDDEWYNLPPLQKQILLSLAERGPQTRNEVGNYLKKATKNVLFSFRSLKEKGLVQKVKPPKFYRQQEFPNFWLTGIGIAFALLHGADPNTISRHIKKGYPQQEEMRLIVSLTKALGSKALALALRMILSYPLEEAISKLSVIGLLEAKKLTSKDSAILVRETMKALKPHPKYYKKHLNMWQSISELSEEVVKTKRKKNR